jgi:hypothetical protein
MERLMVRNTGGDVGGGTATCSNWMSWRLPVQKRYRRFGGVQVTCPGARCIGKTPDAAGTLLAEHLLYQLLLPDLVPNAFCKTS